MKAKNCTTEDLRNALDKNNAKYGNNIKFKRLDITGKQVTFTLTVVSSKGPGARHSTWKNAKGNYTRIAAACWHVHGDFFDALFKIAPDAEIKTGNKSITRHCGNWEDWNIGSAYQPMYYSEACFCGE